MAEPGLEGKAARGEEREALAEIRVVQQVRVLQFGSRRFLVSAGSRLTEPTSRLTQRAQHQRSARRVDNGVDLQLDVWAQAN